MKDPFRYVYYRLLRAKSQQKKTGVLLFGLQFVYSDGIGADRGLKTGLEAALG